MMSSTTKTAQERCIRASNRQFHYILRQYSQVVIKILPFCDKQKKDTDINEGKFLTSYVQKLPVQPPPLCYRNSNECPVHIKLVILYSQRSSPSIINVDY